MEGTASTHPKKLQQRSSCRVAEAKNVPYLKDMDASSIADVVLRGGRVNDLSIFLDLESNVDKPFSIGGVQLRMDPKSNAEYVEKMELVCGCDSRSSYEDHLCKMVSCPTIASISIYHGMTVDEDSSDPFVNSLVKAMSVNSCLRELIVHDAAIEPEIFGLLRINTRMETLDLMNAFIGDAWAKDATMFSNGLRKLHLDRNKIEFDGFESIVKRMTALESLAVNHNSVTNVGVPFSASSSITDLKIGYNFVDEDGGRSLLAWRNLETLDISEPSFSDKHTCDAFEVPLSHSSTITSLVLKDCDNVLAPIDVGKIVQNNTTLTALNLRNTSINKSDCEVLMSNTTITVLHVNTIVSGLRYSQWIDQHVSIMEGHLLCNHIESNRKAAEEKRRLFAEVVSFIFASRNQLVTGKRK